MSDPRDDSNGTRAEAAGSGSSTGADLPESLMSSSLPAQATQVGSALALQTATYPALPFSSPESSPGRPCLALYDLLGSGKYGAVYLCLWHSAPAAIKIMMLPVGDERTARSVRRAFDDEARLHSQLKHPNIVPFFGVAVPANVIRTPVPSASIGGAAEPGFARSDGGVPEALCRGPWLGLVMGLESGGTLHTRLQGRPRPPLETRLRWLRDCAAGLAYLHAAGVVHADLKPHNVLISGDGVAKLADFGFARARTQIAAMSASAFSAPALATQVVGSTYWMAPELFFSDAVNGPERPTQGSDVYAWAITAWTILTMEADPFGHYWLGWPREQVPTLVLGGERPLLTTLPRGTPSALVSLLRCAWSQERADRPSASQVVAILDALSASGDMEIFVAASATTSTATASSSGGSSGGAAGSSSGATGSSGGAAGGSSSSGSNGTATRAGITAFGGAAAKVESSSSAHVARGGVGIGAVFGSGFGINSRPAPVSSVGEEMSSADFNGGGLSDSRRRRGTCAIPSPLQISRVAFFIWSASSAVALVSLVVPWVTVVPSAPPGSPSVFAWLPFVLACGASGGSCALESDASLSARAAAAGASAVAVYHTFYISRVISGVLVALSAVLIIAAAGARAAAHEATPLGFATPICGKRLAAAARAIALCGRPRIGGLTMRYFTLLAAVLQGLVLLCLGFAADAFNAAATALLTPLFGIVSGTVRAYGVYGTVAAAALAALAGMCDVLLGIFSGVGTSPPDPRSRRPQTRGSRPRESPAAALLASVTTAASKRGGRAGMRTRDGAEAANALSSAGAAAVAASAKAADAGSAAAVKDGSNGSNGGAAGRDGSRVGDGDADISEDQVIEEDLFFADDDNDDGWASMGEALLSK